MKKAMNPTLSVHIKKNEVIKGGMVNSTLPGKSKQIYDTSQK